MSLLEKTLLLDAYNSIYRIQEDQGMVGGEAIEELKAAIMDMHGRGAPVEKNDWGFNGGDYTWATNVIRNGELDTPEIPIPLAIRMINVLGAYRNTQFPEYFQLKSKVDETIRAKQREDSPVLNDKPEGVGDKIIIDYTKKSYGKISVAFPKDLDRSTKMKINKVIDAQFEEEGAQKEQDSYGNFGYPRFKKFSQDKGNIDTYFVDPVLIPKILETVFPNIEVVKIGDEGNESQPTTNSKIEIVKEEDTVYGKKLRIKLGKNSQVSKSLFFSLKDKGFTPKILNYAGYGTDGISEYVLSTNKEDYEKIKPALSPLDTTELDEYFAKQPATEVTSGNDTLNNSLQFEDIGGNSMIVKVGWRTLSPEDKTFVKQTVKFMFPDYIWRAQTYDYQIAGDYDQYIKFGQILKANGYDVDNLRKIVLKKRDESAIIPRQIKLKTQQAIDEAIEKEFPNSIFELYSLQREGVRFLYDRKYAILGSETGGGKTVQLIYAAELLMKEKNQKTLIVTLKNVQKQFVDEIVSIMGEDERKEISIDPTNPKKWTVIYYDNFSSGKSLETNVKILENEKFGVLILDELHKIKHSKSKRSQNIEKVAATIPIKWGATATVSSNTPLDVRNQLAMLGHPLGRIKEGTFKKEFAGMVPEGYGGAYVEGTFDDRILAAERLNKWLNLSGVYIRHTKKDMRQQKGEDMPNMEINKDIKSVIANKQTEFNKEYKEKLKSYKDSDLAISQLIAYREIVAKFKADETVETAVAKIFENKDKPENDYAASKVLIFTNFIKAGEEITEKLRNTLEKINPSWKVLTFLSSTSKKDRNKVKESALNPNVKALVMSMKMGGTGISFPNTFKTMIVNDYDWTPEAVEQSEGRIFRINTNQDIEVIYILNTGLDSELYDKVEKKKELAKIIQTYREIFQNQKGEDSPELQKILQAQRELAEIDKSMEASIKKTLGTTIPKEDLKEAKITSFKKFTTRNELDVSLDGVLMI